MGVEQQLDLSPDFGAFCPGAQRSAWPQVAFVDLRLRDRSLAELIWCFYFVDCLSSLSMKETECRYIS